MALLVAEFFSIVGVDAVPPSTLAELIPYMLSVLVGVCLESGVFAVIGKLLNLILDFTRWK